MGALVVCVRGGTLFLGLFFLAYVEPKLFCLCTGIFSSAAPTTAGDGVGNSAGPPVAQAPVLAAVAGVAGSTASDGGGSRAGPPVAQASVLAGVVPVPAHVAKAPAPAAEVGAPAPACK